MIGRFVKTALQVALVTAFMSVAAQAVTLEANGVSVNVANRQPITSSIDYLGYAFYSKGKTFTDTYKFSDVTQNILGDVTVTNPSKFSSLSVQLKDTVSGILINIPNLVALITTYPNNVATFTYSLISGHSYDLIFTGKTVGSGTFSAGYSFSVSAVPLPPAALLLISGLIGIGALGRGRSGAKNVKV